MNVECLPSLPDPGLVCTQADALQALVERCPFGLFLVDARLHILAASALARQCLGLDEFADREFATRARATWPEPFASEVLERFRHTLATGERFDAAPTLVRRVGSHGEEVYDWRLARLPLAGGDHGVACWFYDLSLQQRREAELRHCEARLNALVRASNQSVYRMNADWTELTQYSGGGFVREAGGPRRDWLEEYVPPEERSAVLAAVRAAIESRSVFDLEHRVRLADGSLGWTHSRAVPLLDASGRIVEWFGWASDVTDRKRAEAALRESEARFRGVFESNVLGFSIFDANSGEVLEVNDRLLEITGYTREEYEAGRWDWRSFTPPEFQHLNDRAMEQTLRQGYWEPFEKEWVRRDGVRVPVRLSSAPLPGLPGRTVAVIDDLTEARAAERALAASEARLRELNETLEERIATRTRELEQAHAELRQSQKMEAIGQLTGGIAHDFNNILQGIVSSLELVGRRPGETELVRRWTEAALQAARRGAKLTGQLLAFSRSQKLEIRPVALDRTLAALREMLARTIGPKVRVQLVEPPPGLTVLSDEVQLEMAVLNLAINARDAMPEGGELRVAARQLSIADDPELAAGCYVEIAVTDTGVGMSPEVLSRVFDPFFTTKEVGQGTGLGLSQVYGAVTQAGGAVRIQSAPGQGTTVRLLLRCADAPCAPDETAPSADGAARSGRVLVVDDDADIRRSLEASLQALGYEVRLAQDGAAALALLESERPDVLLVDYAMAGMNGAQVAARAWQRWPGLVVVFASGYAETAAIEAVAGPGARVLRKPFSLADLQSTLDAALSGR